VKEHYLDTFRDLPVMPEVAAKVMNLAEGGHDISFTELERIIKADSGLTARILKIANSALYARQREIKSLQMAITLLGFKNIKILVLLVTASNLFPMLRKSGFHQAYWKHSILSAFFSRKLAVRCGRSDSAEEAFIAGLLHDIGQVVLACSSPERYAQALDAERLGALLLETIEEQMFDANHREVGGALLRKWNFPDLYADVALEHETLNIGSPHKTFVILVSAASILSEKISQGDISPPKRELLDALLPHTCLTLAQADDFIAACSAELAQDSLFQEYKLLFDIR
jgi:HD-like signal output (HDOD) protein